jgi:putative DNA primase/helicase
MGMAIKSELNEDGFNLWESWSQQADSFNDKDTRSTWKSIRVGGGGVTIGTLFHEAQANGWRDDGSYQKQTSEELAERRRIAAEREQQDEADIAKEREQTSAWAAMIWKSATEAKADHPYLTRKRISPVATLREALAGLVSEILGYVPKSGGEPLAGRLLVIPVVQDRQLATLELIDESGRKTALAGRGTKTGGFWATERLPDGDGSDLTVLIGEGVATMISASKAAGHLGIAALSCVNLQAISTIMRERYPLARLTVLADLLKENGEPDPHAVKAAKAVGGLLVVPPFGANREPVQTDFNDLHQAQGLEAVQRAIVSAKVPRSNEEAEPMPLPGELSPVHAFDYDLLPDALHRWVKDIAERVSCPADFVAIPAMLALSCVIGRKVSVRPQANSDWTVTANLWGKIIGRAGAIKTPAMSQATAPLKRLAARAQERYKAEMKESSQSQRVKKLQDEAAEKLARGALAKNLGADVAHLLPAGEDDPEPILRRYTTANATMEALGELLRQNPQGMMLERDEIMGLLRELERDDKADHRAFLLETWDGNGSFTFDRIGRGLNLHIPHLCLSIVGTTQPGRIKKYLSDALRGGASDDGLIQRFSMSVWPDQSGEWVNVDRWPDDQAKKTAWAVFDRLDELDPQSIGALQDTDFNGEPEGTPYLRLEDKALSVFVEWRTELEDRLRSGDLHPAMESHLAKYRKLVPALALICHLADGGHGPVTETAMLRALGWAVYLESHAKRIYGQALAPEVTTAKLILSRIKRGNLPRDGFGSRDVWRPNWSGLTDAETVNTGLAYLVAMDWLIMEKVKTEGRPSTLYRLNGRAAL